MKFCQLHFFSVTVLVIAFIQVNCNTIRHKRHRYLTTHSHIVSGSEESGEMTQQQTTMPMSMSTGGCKDPRSPDCMSPPIRNNENNLVKSAGSQQSSSSSAPPPPPPRGIQQAPSRKSRQVGKRGRGKCFEELEAKEGLKSTEFIPKCRKDGSYANVQCHLQTASCWCVTRGGRPIQGSSILLMSPHDRTRPRCSKYLKQGKSTTQRRSSLAKKNRKNCNFADRSNFNSALIRKFKSEYSRYMSMTAGLPDPESKNDDVVLSWKFDALDRNKDGILFKNETLVLKHLVKQQIQPRACAKNFISFCAKGDQRILRSEWISCLRLPLNLGSPGYSHSGGMHPSQLLKPGGMGAGYGSPENPLNPLRPEGLTDTQEVSNCWTDRQSALASQIRNESVIIPECTVGGLYHKVQCAQGKTYCWCVEEESGIQIPNTVVVNSVPDCNNRYSKPMNGCAGHKKQKFLSDLLDTLMKKMTWYLNGENGRLPAEHKHLSVQEQSARWYFSQLDTDKSGLLERPEWKDFRLEVSKDKTLKKCGKKLPRHCDSNGDRRLTMTEWVDCLGVELLTSKLNVSNVSTSGNFQTRRPVHRSNGRRNGKNPFTDILKQR